MRYFKIGWLALLGLVCSVPAVQAFEHEESLVEFVEYSEDVISRNKDQNKPYFLLFSAEWCHWCHEFAEKTLVRQDVADALNENFVNVFIDTDIHNSAYVKYRATGLPYSVFLNPDGSLYYKYTGTLYGDNFLNVVAEVVAGVGVGKYAIGMESSHVSYTAPDNVDQEALQVMGDTFRQGLLENFDEQEHGLGRDRKGILPRSFYYLLESAADDDRDEVVTQLSNTLGRAVERIYDPVEGGFFRYAETRNWQIPHYEKFADLNAGAVLLLYQLNAISPDPELKQAADLTLEYLMTTLFDAQTGCYLSFQIADTYYYSLNQDRRETARKPKVMDKIFTDRLAVTLTSLIQVAGLTENPALHDQIHRSLDFLGAMIREEGGLKRFYALKEGQWSRPSGLADHAYLARLFVEAGNYFKNPEYNDIAAEILLTAVKDYYDRDLGIFIDPKVDDSSNVEYLMEMNAMLALSVMGLGERLNPGGDKIVASITRYFSQMIDPLEERLWNASEWEFAESYVPLLRAVDRYLKL